MKDVFGEPLSMSQEVLLKAMKASEHTLGELTDIYFAGAKACGDPKNTVATQINNVRRKTGLPIPNLKVDGRWVYKVDMP